MDTNRLAEPTYVSDTFVCGLSHIEDIGNGCLRFVLYSCEKLAGCGTVEPVVVAKIVAHKAALPDALAKLYAFMGSDEALVPEGVFTGH